MALSCSIERKTYSIPSVFNNNEIERDLKWNGQSVDCVKIIEWRIKEDYRPLNVAEFIGSAKIKGEEYLIHAYKHPKETRKIPKWEWSMIFDAPCVFLQKCPIGYNREIYNKFKEDSWWNQVNIGFKIVEFGAINENIPREF